MSKKHKRFEIAGLEQAPVQESQDTEIPKIPFDHWFDQKVKAGEVRDFQEEALMVFFKKQGLKNTEIEDKYNRAFKNF